MSRVFIYETSQETKENALSDIIKTVFLQTTNNLSWLSQGQTVLLKPALNSPDPYPATTHPIAVKTIAQLLTAKGANVIIGDQSGIEHVQQGPQGIIKGSTRKLYKQSGMGKRIKEQFVGFEEEGWDKGFVQYQSPQLKAWPNGYYITRWIQKADHIINLPRISTHIQAGVTLGMKNLVGLLREDSRLAFHANGPFRTFMDQRGKKLHIPLCDDSSNMFHQKITEISLAVKSKLRCTLFVGTKMQVTNGPDAHILGILPSYVLTPRTGAVFAGTDPIATDLVALAFLQIQKKYIPVVHRLLHTIPYLMNKHTQSVYSQPVRQNPFVVYAQSISLGSSDASLIPLSKSTSLTNAIENHLSI